MTEYAGRVVRRRKVEALWIWTRVELEHRSKKISVRRRLSAFSCLFLRQAAPIRQGIGVSVQLPDDKA